MDMMDIQPPKRRPVPPPRVRPKIQLESTRFAAAPVQPQPQPQYTPTPPPAPTPAPTPVAEPTPPPQPAPAHHVQHVLQPMPQPEPDQFEEPAEVTAPVKPKKQKRHKKQRSRKTLWIVVSTIVILLIAGGAVGFLYVRSKQPERVSGAFVADLQTDNTKAAYELTSNAFRAATSEKSLDQLFTKVSINLQGPVKVVDRSSAGQTGPNQAIIVYTVDTDNGTKYVRIVLQKTTKWQVLNFRSSDTALDAKQVN